jgi:hypothetical protein
VPFLTSLGLNKDEQYWFWGVLGISTSLYARYTYKVHLLKRYTKESDQELKVIIGGKFPFTNAELKGADKYIKHYGRNPRYFLLFPLAFMSIASVRLGIKKFWSRKEK